MNYAELADSIISYTQNYEASFIANIPTFVNQTEERVYNTVLIPALRKNVTGVMQVGNKYLTCPSDFLAVLSMAVIDSGNYEYLLNKEVNFLRAAYPNPNDTGLPKYYSLFGPEVTNRIPTNELSFILAPTPDDSYTVELHYYYYPESIVAGTVTPNGLGWVGSSGYTNGTYYNVPFTSDTITTPNLFGTVTISGGSVQSITVTASGPGYQVGDTLRAANFVGGGAINVTVTEVNNPSGRTWLGDNYSPVLLYGSLVEAYIFMKGEQDMMTYYEKKYQDALQQLIRLGAGMERGDAYRDGQVKVKVNP